MEVQVLSRAQMKSPLIVITGPTATGKSALAVELARRFNGEIISADSRQVYRGLDIGSAKITDDEMGGIPHHLIDVADPKYDVFTVAQFQEMATKKIAEIVNRGKLPIICGGTGMYISAVIDGTEFPEVPPNPELRASLESLSPEELFEKLNQLDPARADGIDRHNPVRLIRAIEIADALGSVPKLNHANSPYDVLLIGLKLPKDELDERIAQRVNRRIPALFEEICGLLARGVSSEQLRRFGLEYRYGHDYVVGDLMLAEFIETLVTKTIQFAKRQMQWWKRDERIMWLNPITEYQKILNAVQEFLG